MMSGRRLSSQRYSVQKAVAEAREAGMVSLQTGPACAERRRERRRRPERHPCKQTSRTTMMTLSRLQIVVQVVVERDGTPQKAQMALVARPG